MQRRLRSERDDSLTDGHIEFLQNGYSFAWLFDHETPNQFEVTTLDHVEEIISAWQGVQDELLPQWIAEQPGTRPWAWWLTTAPERRRCVAGEEHPDNGYSKPHPAEVPYWRLFFGKPSCTRVVNGRLPEYETEADYLNRLGLLTDEERAALDAQEATT